MPPEPLSDHLPLWDLVQAFFPVSRRFHEVFAAAGLTPTQFGALVVLDETDGDEPGPSQADLARRILMRPQSMAELVTGLVERGLVARDGPGGRGRRTRLRITPAGREALAAAVPGVNAINAPGALGLTEDEVATLADLLRRVRSTLGA